MLEYEPVGSIDIEDYEPYVGRERVKELRRLSEPLVGKVWANVNSTFVGGGVAEMLRSLVPLARTLGVDARWYAITGHDSFFHATKTFHNLLQGLDYQVPLQDIWDLYLEVSNRNASKTLLAADVVEIHDPQPLVSVMNGTVLGYPLWRCHIDTSSPHRKLWQFMLPYINRCAGAIFTMPEFVGPGLRLPLYRIAPSIDPLAAKNRQYTHQEALSVLAPLFHAHNVDPERPILAAVSRYDVHKNQASILKAFQRLKESHSFKKAPYLIFLGNTATDDPEGGMVLEMLRQQAGEDEDVRFWVNVEDNDRVVGALMKLARGFVHVSTREGFGLVVTEALWQGTPVIGSHAGGIKEQIVDGVTGYLVDPLDLDGIAERMGRLLEHPDETRRLGENGREHVRLRFLLPELLRHYLLLIRFYTRATADPPECSLRGLSPRRLERIFGRSDSNLA